MTRAGTQSWNGCGEYPLKVVAISGVVRAGDNHRAVLFISLHDQGVVNQQEAQTEALRGSVAAEVQQLSEAISIDDDIHVVEAEVRLHECRGIK